MKPTDVVMVKEKTVVPEISQSSNKKGMRRWKVILIAVVVTGLLGVGVTIGAVYLGMKVARENFKEGWVSLKTETGVVEEKVTITNDYQDEIFVPGQYRGIIDHRRNLLFARTIPFGPSECFVVPFNTSQVPSHEMMETLLTTDESDDDSHLMTKSIEIKRTDTVANPNVMTPAAQEMCKDTLSWWAIASEPSTEASREKRDVRIRIVIIIIIRF